MSSYAACKLAAAAGSAAVAGAGAAGTAVPPEGFVLRSSALFADDTFDRSISKFVRRGHLQTEASWTRTWQKAQLNPIAAANETHMLQQQQHRQQQLQEQAKAKRQQAQRQDKHLQQQQQQQQRQQQQKEGAKSRAEMNHGSKGPQGVPLTLMHRQLSDEAKSMLRTAVLAADDDAAGHSDHSDSNST
jgi:hypothetical protein